MRLRFSIKQPVATNCINIDPFPQNVNDEKVSITNIQNYEYISSFVHDSQCTEILLDKCLNYIPFKKIVDFLSFVSSKLRKNGKLIIINDDLNSVISMYESGKIDCFDLNQLLFGEQSSATDFKSSSLSLVDMVTLLEDIQNLKVIKRQFSNHQFIVEATKS